MSPPPIFKKWLAHEYVLMHTPDMKIAVILNAHEYAQVRKQAGLVPLSAYFRNLALGDRSVLEHGSITEQKEAHNVQPKSARAEEKTSADCPHHKRKGELCYKCDPKFGYPAIEVME